MVYTLDTIRYYLICLYNSHEQQYLMGEEQMQSGYSAISSLVQDRMKSTKTEEDVRFALESILSIELPKLGIPYQALYETTIGSGRLDSLFGHLFIEYKKPKYLIHHFKEVVDEKKRYIKDLASKFNCSEDRLIGVLFDGTRIAFLRKDAEGKERVTGLLPVTDNSIAQLISYIHSLSFKALIAKNILDDFGPESKIASKVLNVLWFSFKERKDTRTSMFFNEWKRLFGQVSGFGTGGELNLAQEAKMFGITLNSKEDYPSFVFVLHTYYSIVIKFLALFILQNKREQGYYFLSFDSLTKAEKRNYIEKIEKGEAFKNLGITNFLEGDFFAWYIYEWNSDLIDSISAIISTLNYYEPSTASLKPEAVRDLLKLLYENLLIKALRHDLGEYYTPDWLAEYTIQESGMKESDKILDPTCGSGTYLVLAIKSKIEKLKDKISPSELAKHIVSSVYGFDLNPLAVISSRTNYLLAVDEYLEYLHEVEIPVYLTDSIFSPQKESDCYTYPLNTTQGTFQLSIPEDILKAGKLSEVLDLVERYVIACSENRFSEKQAINHLYKRIESMGFKECALKIVELYKGILALERKRWNRIWCGIIRNYYTSLMLKDFDVIIGNCPWLKWSSLPEAYRDTVKNFCIKYGLFSSDYFVGGIESDVSTILVYSVAEKWLKEGGVLAMLITRTVFKTESAEGFRKFRIPHDENTKFEVIKVDDFTKIKPFEGAINKPALILFKKGEKSTSYPLPWIEWEKNKPNTITPNQNLLEVLSLTNRIQKVAYPVSGEGSPWFTVSEDSLPLCKSLIKKQDNNLSPRKGISTDCNGLYFGNILGRRGEQFIVFQNQTSLGRNKEIESCECIIEKTLVYPIARGREVSSFCWNHSGLYGIIPQVGMDGFEYDVMLSTYPKALKYFSKYEDLLLQRASYRRYQKGRAPYYSCWNVGKYSFAPYKVVWAEISGKFEAAVISYLNSAYWDEPRIVVPDHKIYFIPLEDSQIAHYLCAYLNSPQVSEFVHGYIETTQIGSHITKYLNIPEFKNKKWQLDLASISDQAHKGLLSVEKAKSDIHDILNNRDT